MTDVRPIAEALRAVCAIAGRRLLDRREQEVVDHALELADQVMDGESERDPLDELRAECKALGFRVHPGDRVVLRDAARLLGLSYNYLRALDIGTRYGRGRPGFVQLQEVDRYRRQGSWPTGRR